MAHNKEYRGTRTAGIPASGAIETGEGSDKREGEKTGDNTRSKMNRKRSRSQRKSRTSTDKNRRVDVMTMTGFRCNGLTAWLGTAETDAPKGV